MTTFTEMYASVAGGGAHDGTSAANAWTMAEATAGVTAGDRVNCLAGTYIADDSASSSVMDIDVVGTALAWIEWRAYTTTIGDFTPGQAPPVVLDAGSNSLTNAAQTSTVGNNDLFNRFIGLQFTGASSDGFSGGTTTDLYGFAGCKFDNNGDRGLQCDNDMSLFLCEFTGNTTNAFDGDVFIVMIACRIHNEAVSGAVITIQTISAINNLLYDNGNGVNIQSTGGFSIIHGNTFDGDNQAASVGYRNNSSVNVAASIINNICFDLNIGIDAGTGVNKDQAVRGFNYFSSCNTNYDSQTDAPTDIDDGTTDPFTNSGTRDYTLASGSNAIGAGADAGNIV